MPTYQLQIKQIVDYPRCRIYRQFRAHEQYLLRFGLALLYGN